MREGTESQSIYPSKPAPRGLVTAAWSGRRWQPDGTDVFCGDRRNLPETLFETAHFFAIPDLFPLTPGHILIIPKRHYPCYGAVPARFERELEQAVQRVRAFQQDDMGLEPLIWENGGSAAGQSVRHAHLHIIPMPKTVSALPDPKQALPIATGLTAIRHWWHSHKGGRPYHLVDFRGERRLLPGGSPDVYDVNLLKTQVLNVEVAPDGRHWVRKPNPTSVAGTVMRFRRWEMSHPDVSQHPRRGPGAGLAA